MAMFSSWIRINYERLILFGLAGLICFGAFAHAAHDLWAACIFFAVLSFCALLFCFGRILDGRMVKLPLLLPAILFLTTAWLSGIRSYDASITLLEAWGWSFSWAFFYLLLNTLHTDSDREMFFSAASVTLLPLAIICGWQQATYKPDIWGRWEIHATLNNSIVMAGFALNWLPWLIKRSLDDRKYLAPLCCAMLVLIVARSWWAYAAVSAGTLYFFRRDVAVLCKRHLKLAIALSFLAIMTALTLAAIKLRVHEGPYLGTGRLYYWSTALNIWWSQPLSGAGAGGFAAAYPFFKTGPGQNTLFAHSFILQWTADTGWAGAAALMLLLSAATRLLSGMRPSPGYPGPERSIYSATLVVVLFYGLININLEYLLNRVSLMALLAAELSTGAIPEVRFKPFWGIAVSIIVLLLSPFWLGLFEGDRLYRSGVYYQTMGDGSRAERAFLASIAVNPRQSESYLAMSRIRKIEFEKTASRNALEAAGEYLNTAWRYKKDMTIVHDAIELQRLRTVPGRAQPHPPESAPLSIH